MSVHPFKGGRSVKAPYQQTHLRIPLPIKDSIEKIVSTYRFAVRIGEQSVIDSFIQNLKIAASNYKPLDIAESSNNTFISQQEYEKALQKIERLEAILAIKDEFLIASSKRQCIALELLLESLSLKPNAGGAIKNEIRKAIKLLQS